jgi:hypothetical protein
MQILVIAANYDSFFSNEVGLHVVLLGVAVDRDLNVYVASESNNSVVEIMSAVKEGQQKYCETVYSCSGINHMHILENSKDLLDNFISRSF